MIWTGNRFVAVGGGTSTGALIWTSEDGASWTSRVDNNTNYRLVSVTKQGSRLIAVSDGSTQEWISNDDGVTWTLRLGGSYGGVRIAANTTLFVKIISFMFYHWRTSVMMGNFGNALRIFRSD